jgi:hypothetical protein
MKVMDTLIRILAGIAAQKDQSAVLNAVAPLTDRFSSCALNSAGLVIKTGASTLAKTGSSDFYAVVDGSFVKITASTDMPALTGIDIGAGKYNVVCFFVDKAGTVTAVAGTEGATLGAIVPPAFPAQQALVGMLIITYASAFTGGTTPLDTATTVYLSPTGPFDPSAVLGFTP